MQPFHAHICSASHLCEGPFSTLVTCSRWEQGVGERLISERVRSAVRARLLGQVTIVSKESQEP